MIKVLEPYGLQSIGRMVAVVGFFGLVAQPIIQTWKFVRTPGRLSKVKRRPVAITLAVVAAIFASIAWIPLPYHIDCAFEVRPREAGVEYAVTAGMIEWAAKPGQKVAAGDKILEMQNPDLALRLASYQSEEKIAQISLSNIEKRSKFDQLLAAEIRPAQKVYEAAKELREKTEEEFNRLTVYAKRDGIVFPPPERKEQSSGDGRLPGWTGTPLQQKNRGAYLTPDDVVCEIGDENEFEAVLVIDQGDFPLIKNGDEVDLKLDSLRMESFSSVVTEKARQDLKAASMSMSSQTGGDLMTEIDPATGQVKPRNVSFQARVPLDVTEAGVDHLHLRPGYRGTAKVHVEPMSLGRRLWRLVTKTFAFEF